MNSDNIVKPEGRIFLILGRLFHNIATVPGNGCLMKGPVLEAPSPMVGWKFVLIGMLLS
jgi:hypothetical protein